MREAPLLALRAALASGVLLSACSRDDSEGNAFVEPTRRSFRLARVPGRSERGTTHNPYYDHDGSLLGYTTNVVYGVPSGTSADEVVSFYIESLAEEWRVETEQSAVVEAGSGRERGVVLTAVFTKGDTTVSVNTDNIAVSGEHSSFEVVVNAGAS